MSEVDDSQPQTGWEAAWGLGFKKWCGWRGSNPRPLTSEANTLSTELQPQLAARIVGGFEEAPRYNPAFILKPYPLRGIYERHQ